jgi:hypothetical protein
MTACCHHLFHITTTIEIGDDITTVTFFAAKSPKNVMAIVVVFFCIKAIEDGDGSCCRVLLICKHNDEGNDNKLLSPLLL